MASERMDRQRDAGVEGPERATMPDVPPPETRVASVFPGAGYLLSGSAVQMKEAAGPGGMSEAMVQSVAASGTASGGGEIPHRGQMESAFGTSFGDVKAHTGPAAAHANRTIGAEAYTAGDHVAFASASPTPGVVAHELAHVVQQRAGDGPAGGVGRAGDRHELEAHSAAHAVERGETTDLARRHNVEGGAAALGHGVVQRYESGEHAILGVGAQYPFLAADGDITLPNGCRAFAGEMVAFGDFYSDVKQLAEMPRQESEALVGFCRLDALWTQAKKIAAQAKPDQHAPGSTPANPAPAPGQSSPGVTASKGDHERLEVGSHNVGPEVWDVDRGGKKLSEWRKALHAQFGPAWQFFGITVPEATEPPGNYIAMMTTIGRRRFRGHNDTLFDPGKSSPARDDKKAVTHDPAKMGGDYLDLASQNVSHFAPESWETWKDHHARACKKGQSSDAKEKSLAIIEDMMGSHYLTDRFSSGHTINKAELMQYATNMMLKQAGKDPSKREGKASHEALKGLLDKALDKCFADNAVGKKWDEGVKRAFDRKVISQGEFDLLTGIPKNNGLGDMLPTVRAQIRDVLMEMPWRDADGTPQLGPESRSQGPASKERGQGAYHLGVGNLAALQVHNALNAIGFTVTNGQGKTWRMQGDHRLTDSTQAIAHEAVSLSRKQVEAGAPDEAAILKLMPTAAWIDPQWIRDYFQGGGEPYAGVKFDDTLITNLCRFVDGKKIPLAVAAEAGKPGQDAVSPEMTSICHQVMEILFLAPKDSQGKTQDQGSGTGLNLDMLKAFLLENLPEMVSLSYAAAGAGDLPPAALEAYAPRDQDRGVLPRAANDFRWDGTRCDFNVNVGECKPGEFELGVKVLDKDAGYDFTETGLVAGKGVSDPNSRSLGAGMNAMGMKNEDSEKGRGTIRIRVPADPAPPEGRGGRKFVPASFELPTRNAARWLWDGISGGDDRYLLVYADKNLDGGGMCIGRSGARSDAEAQLSNPHPTVEPPRVTGPEAERTKPQAEINRDEPIVGNSFQWSGASVAFRVKVKVPPGAQPNGNITVYVKEYDKEFGFDYEESGRFVGNSVLGGKDTQIGGVRSLTAKVLGTESETMVLEVASDNPGDTYIVVFADPSCSTPLGRSNTQGENRGGKLQAQEDASRATAISGFQWSGSTLRFRVEPKTAGKVWLKFFDKDWGFDYDESGQPIGGAKNTDPQVGGVRTVAVNGNGTAEIVAHGDANNPGDTYAIVYADPECGRPLARSSVQP